MLTDVLRRAGKQIFKKLQLLEYYEDLKAHDKNIRSVFTDLPRPILDETRVPEAFIKVSFLEKLDREYCKTHFDKFDANTKKITREQFVSLFMLDYNRRRKNFQQPQDYEETLKEAEINWCVRRGVENAWSSTFDKLLSLYNTQDIRKVLDTFTRTKEHQSRPDKRISVNELKNWMQPNIKPSFWKKVCMPDLYKKEKERNKIEFESLLKTTIDGSKYKSKRMADGKKDMVDKEEFIDRIMEELQNGDKIVSF